MLVSGNVQSCFLFSVCGEMSEYLCWGSGELNAPLVHPALNVFTLFNYALKLLPCNRTTKQNNKTVYLF